jgi:hypothetical protein
VQRGKREKEEEGGRRGRGSGDLREKREEAGGKRRKERGAENIPITLLQNSSESPRFSNSICFCFGKTLFPALHKPLLLFWAGH